MSLSLACDHHYLLSFEIHACYCRYFPAVLCTHALGNLTSSYDMATFRTCSTQARFWSHNLWWHAETDQFLGSNEFTPSAALDPLEPVLSTGRTNVVPAQDGQYASLHPNWCEYAVTLCKCSISTFKFSFSLAYKPCAKIWRMTNSKRPFLQNSLVLYRVGLSHQ